MNNTPQSLDEQSELDTILGKLNAEIVMQVCGNFALKEEFGELPKEINDKRAKDHGKIIDKYKQVLTELILKYRINDAKTVTGAIGYFLDDFDEKNLKEILVRWLSNEEAWIKKLESEQLKDSKGDK